MDRGKIQLYVNMGEFFLSHGFFHQAIEEFRKALSFDPDHLDSHIQLKEAYKKAGMTSEAIEECYKLAKIYEKRHDVESHKKVLQEASELGPQGAPPQETGSPQQVETNSTGEDPASAEGGADSAIQEEVREGPETRSEKIAPEAIPIVAEASPSLTPSVPLSEEISAEGACEVPGDYKEHYDRGLEYKERGLIDEAIKEFQMSIKDPATFVDSCEMLVSCYKERGLSCSAIEQLKKALSSPLSDEKNSLWLKYELACLYESEGQLKEAMDVFSEIYRVDKNFNDVAYWVRELKGKMKRGEKEAKETGKKGGKGVSRQRANRLKAGDEERGIPNYLAFYKLKEQPFSIAVDNRFYYSSVQHSEALIRLKYALETNTGLALLIGDMGMGKTTIAKRLWEEVKTRNYKGAFLTNLYTSLTPEWLLSAIVTQLGAEVSSGDKAALINQLSQHLVTLYEKGKKVAILVDEAHLLVREGTSEVLRDLLNCEQEGQKLVTVVLFGLPELAQGFASQPALKQRVMLKCELIPFSENITRDYIQFRLGVAGCEEMLFTEDALKAIYRSSRGVPRLINIIGNNALLEGFLRRKEMVDKEIIEDITSDLTILPSS